MRVFAPGVVKLFGEHAVVYGKPAIAATIDRGIYVECARGDKLVVEVDGVSVPLAYYPEEGRGEVRQLGRFFAYVDAALRLSKELWGELKARFVIRSELPPSIGAATSAAVSVGVLKAYSSCAGADVRREELARLGHRVELEVQGVASPMDTAAVALGGVLKIWPAPFRTERLEVELPPFYIVVLPRRGTTAEIVADVRSLLGRRKSLAAVVDAIGAVVEEAHRCLVAGDLACVGELMRANNWLLGALGVVDSRAVSVLEMAGPFIYGGKISGAGRGGVLLLLPREDGVEKVLSALGYPFYKVAVSKTGVVEV
ncbi:MAG: mevalonate kinase [Pyrobaculum sp.]